MLLRKLRLVATCLMFWIYPEFSLNLGEVLYRVWRALRHFFWGHQWSLISRNIRQCYDCQRYEILHDLGRSYSHYMLWLPIRSDSPEVQALLDQKEENERELEEIRRNAGIR